MDGSNAFVEGWKALKNPAAVRKFLAKIAVFLAIVAALAVVTYQTNPAIVILLAPVCMAFAFWRLAFLVDNFRDL